MNSLKKFRPTVLALFWPLALPTAIILPVELNFLLGGVLYVHGPLDGLIIFGVGLGGCALVWEIVALPFFIYKLRQETSSRTACNIFALLASSAYILFSTALGVRLIG